MLALLVKDYDEAIQYYTGVLGFKLLEDTDLGNGKRWVVVQPQGNGGAALLLAKAKGAEQEKSIGAQTGGRVFLFLHTDDFNRDYTNYSNAGVEFVRPPSNEAYGLVSVFKDLYGNLWDLIQPKTTKH